MASLKQMVKNWAKRMSKSDALQFEEQVKQSINLNAKNTIIFNERDLAELQIAYLATRYIGMSKP